jgi:transposase
MDNYMVHQTQEVRSIFTDRVQQRFLPPYTCALNPIERFWNVVKTAWRKKVVQYCEGMTEEEQIEMLTDLLKQNNENAKSIAFSHVQTMIQSMQGKFV